jgi:hypothetical protein
LIAHLLASSGNGFAGGEGEELHGMGAEPKRSRGRLHCEDARPEARLQLVMKGAPAREQPPRRRRG